MPSRLWKRGLELRVKEIHKSVRGSLSGGTGGSSGGRGDLSGDKGRSNGARGYGGGRGKTGGRECKDTFKSTFDGAQFLGEKLVS
nr:hypothetical protein [Tanacetum cinerariifolium]